MTMRGEDRIAKSGGALPESFQDLEPFAHWALATEVERMAARENSSIEELQVFYDALMRRMPAIVDYLNQFALDQMPEPAQQLLLMALSLNEVSLAVERYRQPRVINGRERARFFPGK
jgi:hypothetical protein